MTFRTGPYRIEVSVRYVRTNRRRCPLVRLRFVAALLAVVSLAATVAVQDAAAREKDAAVSAGIGKILDHCERLAP